MAEFQSYAPGVEVAGRTLFSVVEAAGAFRSLAIEILADQGIKHIREDEWYSQQAFLNAFREIRERVGSTTLRRIGSLVPAIAQLPPADDMTAALKMLNLGYEMNHRNGPIGRYEYEPISSNEGRMICENPYPCEFDEGLLEGVLKLYGAKLGKVSHAPGPCRSRGDDVCHYFVSW
ncbi:MAG: hypothetical protein AAGE52_33385 [Myxococcota bacterium]